MVQNHKLGLISFSILIFWNYSWGVKIDFVGKNSKSKEKSEEQLRQQYTTNNQVIKSEDQNRGLHVVQIKKVKHNGVEINSK